MILLFALLVLIPLFIIPFPILLFTFIFWGNLTLREVGLGITLYAALLSGMVGGFYGIFVIFHELYPNWSRSIKHFFSRETLLSRLDSIKRLLHPARHKKRFTRKALLSRWRSIKQLLRPSRAKLRVSPRELLKGAFIGFIWLSVYWLLFIVLFLRVSLSQVFLPIILTCGSFGAIAGSVWLGYIHKRIISPTSDLLLKWGASDGLILLDQSGHPITSTTAIMQRTALVDQYGNPFPQARSLTQNRDTTDIDSAQSKGIGPAFFNRSHARGGGCFWLLLPLGIVCALLLPGGFLLYVIFHASPLAVLVTSFVTAAILGISSFFSGWLVGGISQFATWWIHQCSARTLGRLGIILTVFGLVIGLIVPAIAIADTSFELQTNTNSVNAVAWSPDDTHIAAGNSDGSVQIWDVITGQRLHTFSSNTNSVNSLIWSPDGTSIASVSSDDKVRVWDATTGKLRFPPYDNHTYSGYTDTNTIDYVYALAWSPDGTRIASGDYDGTVQVWNATNGHNLFTYDSNLHSNGVSVYALAWSTDGTRIASGNNDGTVQVWNATTDTYIFTYPKHSDSINAIAWSPDSTHIASVGLDDKVQVWNASTRQPLLTYSGHTDIVDAVTWSPDGTRIASGGADGTVQVWGAFTGDLISTYQGNAFSVSNVNTIAWSHDGTHIMAGSYDGAVRIWTA